VIVADDFGVDIPMV
jgi:arylsulfatase A-like enzyme